MGRPEAGGRERSLGKAGPAPKDLELDLWSPALAELGRGTPMRVGWATRQRVFAEHPNLHESFDKRIRRFSGRSIRLAFDDS